MRAKRLGKLKKSQTGTARISSGTESACKAKEREACRAQRERRTKGNLAAAVWGFPTPGERERKKRACFGEEERLPKSSGAHREGGGNTRREPKHVATISTDLGSKKKREPAREKGSERLAL